MKKYLYFVFFILFVVCPAHAQWKKVPLHKFKARAPRVPATHTLATHRAMNQALQHKLSHADQLAKSTLLLNTNDDNFCFSWQRLQDITASGFIFQEEYKGKIYLWGATASHYSFMEPFLIDPQSNKKVSIQFLAQGHYGRNDVTLFPIPAQMQKKYKPLKLANRSPQKGETLSSAGYFDDGFQIEKNRVVTEVLPTRILTSLVVEDKLAREGACGGPVLNKQGELVGMHVGSSDRRQAGFIVPVQYIRELLQAYHNEGKSLRPLYFNHTKIGDININEYISSIDVWKDGKKVETFLSYSHRAFIDYNHLEEWVDASQADKLVFYIERTPFSSLDSDDTKHLFAITYDLQNSRISKKQIH